NFDIKYDMRDGQYKFFEINTRQGRSNYYVTGAGFNIARYLVEDYIYQEGQAFEVMKKPYLWSVVPKQVAFKYVKMQENLDLMKDLIKEEKMCNPLFFQEDLPLGRFMRMMKNHFSHFRKFRKYYS